MLSAAAGYLALIHPTAASMSATAFSSTLSCRSLPAGLQAARKCAFSHGMIWW